MSFVSSVSLVSGLPSAVDGEADLFASAIPGTIKTSDFANPDCDPDKFFLAAALFSQLESFAHCKTSKDSISR